MEATRVAASRREKILDLEQAMRAMPEHVEFETRHYYAHGLYAREIVIPAGVVVTGKIHRTQHLTIVSKGRVLVTSSEAGTREIVAPCTFASPPGTKRAVYALEETVWTTIHGTHQTDLERLEKDLIAPTFEALSQPRWRRVLGRIKELLWRG